jgi:hypothetical protein
MRMSCSMGQGKQRRNEATAGKTNTRKEETLARKPIDDATRNSYHATFILSHSVCDYRRGLDW